MFRRSFLGGLVGAAALTAPALARTRTGTRTALPAALAPVSVGGAQGFLARPERPNGLGVVLLPTIAGVNAYMRTTATALAARGHAVIVWDPYFGETVPKDTMGQLARSLRITDDAAMAQLAALTAYFGSALGQARVATIGWCMGGRLGLVHGGLDPRVDGVIAYNPTIYSPTPVPLYGVPTSKADFPGETLDEFALAARIKGPVQVFRPGKDLAQPAEYERLQAALQTRRAPTLFSYFPEAEHGFAYRQATAGDRAAAAIAWPATLALLDSLIPSAAQTGA